MTPVTVNPTATLQLGTIPHPGWAGTMVRFFRDWQTACNHLRDHLLTAPECEAGGLVAPKYRSMVDPADADARWRYAEQARETQGASAQPLYDLYSEAAGRDAQDAAALGWVGSKDRVTVALGTSGILLVVEETVTTALLPGQGDPEATRAARSDPRIVRGLVRERGMRSGRVAGAEYREHERERRVRLLHQAHWTEPQRLYYHVFKPAVQFIKKCHHRYRDMYGKLIRRDYALVKDRLPPRSQLKFDNWAALRRQCRGG